jgi:hypothetical protein
MSSLWLTLRAATVALAAVLAATRAGPGGSQGEASSGLAGRMTIARGGRR